MPETETAPVQTPATTPAKPITPEPTEDYVVDGKTIKLTKSQAKTYVQKGMFADKTLKSVDVLKKSTESIVNALKNPETALKLIQEAGVSHEVLLDKIMEMDISDERKEKLAAYVYNHVVKEAKLTPEQIEQNKKLQEYEKLKKTDEDRKKNEEEQRHRFEVQQVYQALRTEVTKQITSTNDFPKTEGSIREVMNKLRVMNRKGIPPTPENVGKAITLVKKDLVMYQQSLLDTIEDPEKMISLFGEERALKISKALVARLQNKAKITTTEAKPEETKEKVTDSLDRKYERAKNGLTVMKF